MILVQRLGRVFGTSNVILWCSKDVWRSINWIEILKKYFDKKSLENFKRIL
jgi:hypothetical protein